MNEHTWHKPVVELEFFDILLGVASGFLGVVFLVSAVEVWVFVSLGYWWPLKTVVVFALVIVGIALLVYAREKISGVHIVLER